MVVFKGLEVWGHGCCFLFFRCLPIIFSSIWWESCWDLFCLYFTSGWFSGGSCSAYISPLVGSVVGFVPCKFLNNTKDIYLDLFEGILSTFQVKMFKSAITGRD
jgi:hypothetical protein